MNADTNKNMTADTNQNNRVILKGDIYYADLSPVIKSEQGGVRPVVIVQNNFGNKFSRTTIVMAITSQLKNAKVPTHIKITKEEFDFLEKDSIILGEQIRTIDKIRLREYIGSLDENTMLQVQNVLNISFGMHC